MDTIQLIAEISVLKKKMDKAEAFLEELVEYLLVTCKDDDYITPEVICRKLAKYGYIELENGYWINPLSDRKTESNSEIPNNCEDWHGDCKTCEWYDGTSCGIPCCDYEPKDEPQTNADQRIQSVESVEPTWTKEEHEAFYTFLWNVINPNEMQDYIGMFEPKDEPQTETEIAKAIVHKAIDDAVIAEDAYPDLRQKMHDAVDEYEPQTDCAWK